MFVNLNKKKLSQKKNWRKKHDKIKQMAKIANDILFVNAHVTS